MTQENTGRTFSEQLHSQSGKHMGDIVGWNQYGSHNRIVVEGLLDKWDLANDVNLPKVTAISAYRRTVSKICRTGKRDERMFEIFKIDDTASKIVHAVVKKGVVSNVGDQTLVVTEKLTNNDADFSTETKFAFNKDQYNDGVAPEYLMKFQDPSHPLAIEAKKMYDGLCVVYTAEDIRQGFQRAFHKWGGVRMLDKGGAWWIPPTASGNVRRWNAFMADINSTTMVIPIFDTTETVDSLQTLTRESLEGQIEDLFSELEAFSSKDNTRLGTLERRVEAFDDLMSKAELYERLLGYQLDEIKKKVSDASASLCATIGSIHG